MTSFFENIYVIAYNIYEIFAEGENMSHRLTAKKVDKVISDVEKRYQSGEANDNLYEMRMSNLKAIKEAIKPKISERLPTWQREEKSQNRNKIKK